MEQEPRKEYSDNQIHGGIIVSENVRAVFTAIRPNSIDILGQTGETEVDILLMSLPVDDQQNLNPKVETIKKKYEPKLRRLANDPRWNQGTTQSKKNQVYTEWLHLMQKQSLEITQAMITYLDSIGQWWLKKNTTPVSVLTYAEEMLLESKPEKP